MADLYSQAVLADSPGLYARMHATSGSTETDASTNAASGTYSGTVTLNQPGGLKCSLDKSVLFSGAGTLSFPHSIAINTGGAFTVEAWIKSDGTGGSWEVVCQKYASPNGWILQRNNVEDGVSLGIFQSSGTNNTYFHILGVSDSLWHHIVFVVNGTTVTGYRDGSQYVTGSITAGSGLANTQALAIGSSGTGSNFWTGGIDEVAVYLTALSAARIAAHYQAGVQAGISRILKSSLVGRTA